MIKKLEIENLFGRFEYVIRMESGGVTIITGPNGYGKSTILNIIDAISNKKIGFFFKLEFSKIKIYFENEKKFEVSKKKGEIFFNNIPFTPKDPGFRKVFFNIRHKTPYYRQFSDTEIIDIRNDKIMSVYDFFDEDDVENIFDIMNSSVENDSERTRLHEIVQVLTQMTKLSGKTRLVSDQRLIKRTYDRRGREEDISDAVVELPKLLREIIEKVSSQYSTEANKLDSTYPSRLLKSVDGISKSEYEKKLSEARLKFEKLKEYNLTTISLLEEGIFDEKYATALKIYFDDFSEKYKVFEKLINQLDLFTNIINSRLTFKKLEISREVGLIIRDNDRELELNKLSSGEKQEIVLFFDLIFNTDNYDLLLIDEPELSLHVIWQQNFLDDLLKVTHMNDLKVIIATHSPQIIGNHRDIQVDLGGLYNNEQ